MFGNGVVGVLGRSEDFRDENFTRLLNHAIVAPYGVEVPAHSAAMLVVRFVGIVSVGGKSS